MPISHAKSITIPDDGDPGLAHPSDWNSAHNFTQNLMGNTAGASSAAGTDIVWAGGNNVTLSASGNTVSVHGPSFPPALTQDLSVNLLGNTLGTNFVTGSQVFLQGGSNVTLSGTGSTVVFVGGAGGGGGGTLSVNLLGNTSGTSLVTGTQLYLAGGNNVTLSASGSSVTISGPNTVAQTNQTIGLVATSNTTQGTSGTADARSLSFAGAGVVSVGITNGSVVISAPAAAGDGVNVVSASGNTSGTLTTFSTGTVVLAGGNNVTLSQSSNTITISAAAQTNQSGDLFAGAQSFGTSSGTYDARTLSFVGSGAVSVAVSNSGIVISSPVQTAESNTLGISNLGNTSGTSGVISGNQVRLLLAGGNNVTLSQSVNGASATITVSAAAQTNQSGDLFVGAQSFGTSSGTYDGRTLSINGSGAVSVAASNSGFVISVPTQTAESNTFGVSNLGNTVGTSGTFASNQFRLILSGGNNITLSQVTAAGQLTIGISGPNTAAQTNQSGGLFAGAQSFGTSSGTYDARTLSINGSGAVSVAASNSGFVISAPVQTNQTLGLFAVSNTTQQSTGTVDARNLSFAGAGIASVGITGNSVLISVPSGGGAGDGVNIISASGNTTGTLTSFSTGTVVLAGGNNITLSQSSNTITISAASQTNQSGNLFAGAQSTGTSSGTFDARTLSINGAGAVSVGASNSGFVVSAPNISSLFGQNLTVSTAGSSISFSAAAPVSMSAFEPREFNHHLSYGSLGQNSLWIVPFTLPEAMNVSRLNMVLSLNAATGATASEQVGFTHRVALYTRASATTQSLSTIFSTSHTARQSANSNTSWLVDWNGNSTSSGAGVGLSGAMTGQKIHTVPMATLLPAGDYFLGVMVSSSSVGSSAALQVSHGLITGLTGNVFGYPGGTASSAASLNPMMQAMGTYTATTSAFPNTIHISQVNGMASQQIPYFNLMNYGTS